MACNKSAAVVEIIKGLTFRASFDIPLNLTGFFLELKSENSEIDLTIANGGLKNLVITPATPKTTVDMYLADEQTALLSFSTIKAKFYYTSPAGEVDGFSLNFKLVNQ